MDQESLEKVNLKIHKILHVIRIWGNSILIKFQIFKQTKFN